jgi:hypothetical protein
VDYEEQQLLEPAEQLQPKQTRSVFFWIRRTWCLGFLDTHYYNLSGRDGLGLLVDGVLSLWLITEVARHLPPSNEAARSKSSDVIRANPIGLGLLDASPKQKTEKCGVRNLAPTHLRPPKLQDTQATIQASYNLSVQQVFRTLSTWVPFGLGLLDSSPEELILHKTGARILAPTHL